MLKKRKEVIIEKIKLTNPNKLLFQKPNITKKEVAIYYQKVAKRMLPFVKKRIISSVRCPDGINQDCFFKKHIGEYPLGLKRIDLPNEKGHKEDYYYIINSSGVISEVQMNTIEFHIWGSRVPKINEPDMMVFDLDPDEKLELNLVRAGVKDLKSILDDLNLVSFLKTSGGKGYHVVVPFKKTVSWDKFRLFAKNIALLMQEKWPDKYTSNMRKTNRKNKIFVDWVRNTKSSTSIAPYSLRIKNGASVSMPIKWSELDKVKPNGIKLEEAIKRLQRKDPWDNFFDINQSIK